MADFRKWPHSLVTNVRGQEINGSGRTAWHVDGDGILHINHQSEDNDLHEAAYRLVPVEQVWVEAAIRDGRRAEQDEAARIRAQMQQLQAEVNRLTRLHDERDAIERAQLRAQT